VNAEVFNNLQLPCEYFEYYLNVLFLDYFSMSDLKVPSANEWGKKRVDFYVNAASRIREDGLLNEEEQDVLELEEQDAVERQHKMDSLNSVLDYRKLGAFADFSDEDDDDDEMEIQPKSNGRRPAPAEISDKPAIKRIVLKKKSLGQLRLESKAAKEKEAAEKQSISKPTKRVNFKLDKKQGPKQRKQKADFVDGWDEDNVSVKDDDHRQINYEMQKNKGLLQKRKKEASHSRVKRRAQYKKALIKRRSQVPDVRRETTKYSGESRGIRMSTVRSVPLKA